MENQNVAEMNYKDLTDEHKEILRKLVLDLVFTAVQHIDWHETAVDFTDHHTPEEYGTDEDTIIALLDVIANDMDGHYDEDVSEIKTDEFYSDLFKAALSAVFAHVNEPSAEPEKLN
jgi:hypothetical protein